MTISVVIPHYNQAQYLKEAIDSVINQTVKPLELIVVNDGSPDSIAEIEKQYADPVKFIHQVNKGLPAARNTGIMNASGEYIVFLDADDALHPEYISEVGAMAQRTNADIIAPSFQTFGTTSEPVILSPTLELKDFADANRAGYFCAIRRSALLAIGGYSPRMVYGYEDWHLTINLLSRGYTIRTIQKPLVFYRTKENSMIHDAQNHHQELVAQIYKDFPGLRVNPVSKPLIQSPEYNG